MAGQAAPGQWTSLLQPSQGFGAQDSTTSTLYNLGNLPADWAKSIGFNGPTYITNVDHDQEVNPAFIQYMQQNGIDPQRMYSGEQNGDNYTVAAKQNGQTIGNPLTYKNSNDSAFWYAAMLASAAAGGAIGSAGTAATDGTVSGMDLAADAAAGSGNNIGTAGGMLGNSSYGGSLANLGDAVGGAGGDATLGNSIEGGTNMFADGSVAPNYAAGDTWGSTAGAVGGSGGSGIANAAGKAGSSIIPGISNGQLLTTGAGLLGGALGSTKGMNSATNSTQNSIDPRMAPYLYGANGNGGLLNSVNNLTNAQLATGGLNANQSQGLQMQLNALNDPAYTQGLAQMRSAGQGLLGAPQAGNAFTSGTGGGFAPQAGQMPQQAGQAQSGWQPMQTQLNAPKPGMSTGLLGNLRPYGQ